MSPEVSAPRYAVDAGMSRISLKITAGGPLAFLGHSPRIAAQSYYGSIDVNPRAPQGARVQLVVESASLIVMDEIKAKDRKEIEFRMRDEILEIDRYPEIAFESYRVNSVNEDNARAILQVDGIFALHGVSRDESISVQTFFNDDTVRAVGEFRLKQTNYRIKPVSALGGGLVVKDEIVCSFQVLARKET